MRDRSLSSTCPALTAQLMQPRTPVRGGLLLRPISSALRSSSSSSPLDGTGPSLRSRPGEWPDRSDNPLDACTVIQPASQPASLVRARRVRDAVTMDTLRPGMRGRLRTAPCKAVAACAGARVREEGDGERHSEREHECVCVCACASVCVCMVLERTHCFCRAVCVGCHLQ